MKAGAWTPEAAPEHPGYFIINLDIYVCFHLHFVLLLRVLREATKKVIFLVVGKQRGGEVHCTG